ncbi:MAG: Fic family protein [Proteocatella sp.]
MKEFKYREIDKELYTPEIINLIVKIHEFKGKQELFIEAKPDILESMLEIAKIQSTGASNRIEGIFTSDARLNELVMKKSEPQNRDEEEIAGYREVLNTIHENYDYMMLSSNIILQLHRDLYSFHPTSNAGKFKNQDNVIEEIDAAGIRTVRFEPLSAFETPDAIERLCREYIVSIREEKIDPLILIAKFIFDFLSIHPFNDGNGRMSRLLTLMLLYQQGYIVGKYISIEMIIEQTKETYYQTLKQSSKDWLRNEHNYFSFVRYYLGIILKAYKEFSDRVETVAMKGLSKTERVKDVFDKRIGKISKAEIQTICPDVSIATIEKTLSDLLKKEYIIKVGAGKTTKYIKNHNKMI